MPTTATPSDNFPVVITGVNVGQSSEFIPHTMTLANYPNPFNPATKIQFTVEKDGKTSVRIFNALGQEVARVFEGMARAGTYYSVEFGGPQLASGVYFCTLENGGQRIVTKMLLVK